jgi:hypothetical protein
MALTVDRVSLDTYEVPAEIEGNNPGFSNGGIGAMRNWERPA